MNHHYLQCITNRLYKELLQDTPKIKTKNVIDTIKKRSQYLEEDKQPSFNFSKESYGIS
jgi:hypothetical protein